MKGKRVLKKSLAVIFGGRTPEHDISIITAHQFMENADASKYDIHPVYISRKGEWFTGSALRSMKALQGFSPSQKNVFPAFIEPVPGGGLCVKGAGLFKPQKEIALDAVVVAMHGMHGEDGTLQGLLELADLPYTSPALLGSAVGMDKIMMKSAFREAGVNVLDGLHFLRSEWDGDEQAILGRIETDLGYPVFIKPANLGSSIGIGRATDRESLTEAINVAIQFDRRILAERGLDSPLEYNCACLGYGAEALASEVERPVSWQSFLSFEEKYMRGAKSAGMKSLERELPAKISSELKAQIQAITRTLFKELDCKGVVRVDYLYDEAAQTLYVNEINTIPGSFAFYLFEPLGIKFSDLIDRIVGYAFLAHDEKSRSSFAFDSDVLSKAEAGFQKGAK